MSTERYVALVCADDLECYGFTNKVHFDSWSSDTVAVFLEDTDGIVEFEGPKYPGETATPQEVDAVFAEVKRLAKEACGSPQRQVSRHGVDRGIEIRTDRDTSEGGDAVKLGEPGVDDPVDR